MKMWYMYSTEYCLAEFILSEVTHPKRQLPLMFSFIIAHNSRSSDVNMYPGETTETMRVKRDHCQVI